MDTYMLPYWDDQKQAAFVSDFVIQGRGINIILHYIRMLGPK